MAKVYVASSWSNEHQPRIVAFLRERGHEVYDFRNPERKTDFRWSQISGNWEKMEKQLWINMAVIWCFPAMKMNLRQWSSCKEMVFVCVIWSFDDMGLGEQVILSDKESKGGYYE